MTFQRPVFLGIGLFLIVVSMLAQSMDYSALIGAADVAIKQGDYIGALANAQKALRQDSERFEAYYFCAFALFKRDLLDEATPLANDASRRAPADQKADVQRLLDAISKRRDVIGLIRSGEEALSQGLVPRAAATYREAWMKSMADPAIGLKAADLSIKSGDFPAAATVLRSLAERAIDAGATQRANQLLADIHGQLEKTYNKRVEMAKSAAAAGHSAEALASIAVAITARPDQPAPYLLGVRIYASVQDKEHTGEMLLEGAKSGQVTAEAILAPNVFDDLFEQAWFLETVGRAFGAGTQAKAVERAERNRELQRRFSRALSVHDVEQRKPLLDQIVAASPENLQFQAALKTAQTELDRLSKDRQMGLYTDGINDTLLADLRKIVEGDQIVKSLSFPTDNSFAAIVNRNGYWWRGVPDSLAGTLKDLQTNSPQEEINTVAATVDDWIVTFGNGGYRCACSRSGLSDALERINRSGELATDVSFAPGAGWLIIRNYTGWLSNNVSPQLSSAISEVSAAGTPISHVSVAPGGGWVIIIGTNGYRTQGIPQKLAGTIQTANRDHVTIRALAFTPSGGWALIRK